MAQIDPSKKPSPIVVALGNFFCCAILGYYMCGQTSKGVMALIVAIVLSIVGIGWIIGILAAIDGMQVAEALQKGEAVDENEYKFELHYKIMSLIHKDAIYNAPAA